MLNTPPSSRRWIPEIGLVVGLAVAAVAVFMVFAILRDPEGAGVSSLGVRDPGPVHVHGLGVDPADESVFIATHTGTWRLAKSSRKAVRVSKSRQDTMGFTVVGPGHFLASGHPDARDDLPPLLGLIESTDAGRSWKPVSLLGKADFHALRAQGSRVYGINATTGEMLISRDAGRTWVERRLPGPTWDFTVHPVRSAHLIAVTEQGSFASPDEGRTWEPLAPLVGLLAWPTTQALFLIEANGIVQRSSDAGATWQRQGSVGGQPTAVLGAVGDLYVAVDDGTIKRSSDHGRTWQVISTP